MTCLVVIITRIASCVDLIV